MTDGTLFNISMPICKVDKDKRMVEGYATTEDIDKQNEQVDYEASKDAFGNWTGNIREMHEPKAVGKAVSWEPDDNKRGVFVRAYISKGAEDTWQKVLDGTLKAFSIGGQTVNKVAQIVKDDKGGQRNVTKITKYKLTELSLVDNPANPAATFGLVKMADGVPMQTEIVEDMKKVVISQSEDILDAEVKEHRHKADSLVKKVLSSEELDKLDSENWGVIRKYEKEGTHYIERMLPMPDKVHAVRALEVVDKYSLKPEEQERVHEIAKSILGSDYEFYASTTKQGGEIKKMNKEILDTLKTLGKRIGDMEVRVFGKANMDTDSNLKTQEDVKTGAPDNSAKETSGSFTGKVPVEGEKQTLPDVKAADSAEKPIQTQEEGNVAPKKKDDVEVKGDTEGKVPAEGAKQTLADVDASKADPKQIQTQVEGNVAPVKKEAGKIDEAKDAKPELKTQEEGNVAPVKTKKSLEMKEEEKVEKSVNELILAELKSLSKRIDAIESKPLPRKYHAIEKRFGNEEKAASDGLEEEITKALELRKQERNGRKLTTEEVAFCDSVVAKSLNAKFVKTL